MNQTKRIVLSVGFGLVLCAMNGVLLAGQIPAEWKPKKAPLMTEFSKDVNPGNALPDYPRPQMVRDKWLNLNGVWEFETPKQGTGRPETFTRSILVPFPVQAALSGIMEHHERVWYRRKFDVPTDWKGQRILLNFGAVDWECEVFLNQKSIGVHRGGYDPFSFDITDHLTAGGPQELVVRVFDPTEQGGQPRGKQATRGIPILYTPCTGIWQTVWIEPVPAVSIDRFVAVPDIDRGVVKVKVSAKNSSAGAGPDVERSAITLTVKAEGRTIREVTGRLGQEIEIPVENARLWSPEDPFLYDLNVMLKSGDVTDAVTGYFGMRKVSLEKSGPYRRILLNNKFVFQLGALDQGYWPDGNYTAPTDAALKFDIEQQKALGFNMIRKHVKVEPLRWYYWADKLGILVWQDMPTANSYGGVDADAKLYPPELTRMVETLYNTPSVIMWTVYNEKCGQDAHIAQGLKTSALVEQVRALDSSRVINEASGYDWYGSGDIADAHTYPAPAAVPGRPNQAIVSGEYGAIKYPLAAHQWAPPDDVTVRSEQEYLQLYTAYAAQLCQLKAERGMSGAVYTQITDVETEQNGIFTYDRKATKTDPAKLREANLRAIHERLKIRELFSTSREHAQTWRYTTNRPAADWIQPAFQDDTWQTGNAPFAQEGSPDVKVGTSWTSDDIWLRTSFNPGKVEQEELSRLCLIIYHDDECEVYLNGTKIADIKGTNRYTVVPLTGVAGKVLKPDTANTLAVHCHEGGGDQGIDVGVGVLRFVHD